MNTYYTGKFLKMTYWRQMREVLPIYLLAIIIYIAGAKIFHFDIWDEAISMLVKVKDRLLRRA